MNLLVICCVVSFLLGVWLTKKIGFSYYSHKLKKMININQRLIDEIDEIYEIDENNNAPTSNMSNEYDALLAGVERGYNSRRLGRY